MKKTIALLFLLAPVLLMAQDEDAAIRKVVNDYLDGGTNGNVEQFKSAFEPSAIQRSIGKTGSIIGMTVEKLSSKIKPGSTMNRETRIAEVFYAGISATALTETIHPNSKIVDMLNLLKTDDGWKIVSRVYSRIGADEEIQGIGSGQSPSQQAYKKDVPAQSTTPKKKETVTWDDDW